MPGPSSISSYDSGKNAAPDLKYLRKADSYDLRHLAVHLYEAKRHKELYHLLVGSKAWMIAKSERFSDDRPFINEVELTDVDIALPPDPLDLAGITHQSRVEKAVAAGLCHRPDNTQVFGGSNHHLFSPARSGNMDSSVDYFN